MFGSALGYVMRHPGRAVAALGNPVAAWDTLHERFVQAREYRRGPYTPDTDRDWEQRLLAFCGASDDPAQEFRSLWPRVIADVEARGLPVGPMSFNGFNDGDVGFVRAIWTLVRCLKPAQVVETGVAHGFTSRFILEAMARNRSGHLSSIDCPPLDPEARKRIGVAVGDRFAEHWSLIFGASRRKLRPLLSRLGRIDIFIHDSRHTEHNVRFELESAWRHIRPGGVLVVDDIDTNWGFDRFVKSHSGFKILICEAEPVKPDPRRYNKKGVFGIILKDAATHS